MFLRDGGNLQSAPSAMLKHKPMSLAQDRVRVLADDDDLHII